MPVSLKSFFAAYAKFPAGLFYCSLDLFASLRPLPYAFPELKKFSDPIATYFLAPRSLAAPVNKPKAHRRFGMIQRVGQHVQEVR